MFELGDLGTDYMKYYSNGGSKAEQRRAVGKDSDRVSSKILNSLLKFQQDMHHLSFSHPTLLVDKERPLRL